MKRDTTVAWNQVDADSLDLKGLNVAVVGGTGGIGRALSRLLASRGASVIVVGRTLREGAASGVTFIKADLSLISEAHRVATALPAERLDLLVLTTGIFAAPKRHETSEGIEEDMAVSYLSRLVLVRDLGPRLGTGRTDKVVKPRVFVMGFPGTNRSPNVEDFNSENAYKAMDAHMKTVAGNEALVIDSANRYPRINFYGLNPGLMKTSIRSNLFGATSFRYRFMESTIGLVTPTPENYATRIVPLLVSPDIEAHSGAMFDRKGRAIAPSSGLTESYVSAIMATSEGLVRRAEASAA